MSGFFGGGGGGGGTTDHAALASNLAWTTSGHTGTASTVAGFNSGSTAAALLTYTTVGSALLGLTNPSAVTYLKIAADNTVSTRTAAQMLGDLGAMPLAGGTFSGNVTFADGINVVLDTTTGTKIGTGTTQKIGFFNATPVARQSVPGAVTLSGTYGSDFGNIQSLLNGLRTAGVNLGVWA